MDLNQKPIAMAYMPWQTWKQIYDPAKALNEGTIFAELNKEFTGKARPTVKETIAWESKGKGVEIYD